MNGENIKQMPDIELQIVTPLKFDNCNQKLFRLCKKRVCDELNGLIGFKTDVNYKVTEALVVNDVLTMHFPLEIHIQNEASNVDELINMRINKIKQFFENFDIEKLCPGQSQCAEEGGRFGFCYENGEFSKVIGILKEKKIFIRAYISLLEVEHVIF